jgi:hypothetical protein
MTPQDIHLSAAVMTHPSRREQAEHLRDRYPELELAIVMDPAPENGSSALRTSMVAWSAVADGATHHLVLQDDAAPCEDFLPKLKAAIAAAPDDAVCLFTEWGSETSYLVRLALMHNLAWAEVVDHYVPTVALAMPAPLASGFGKFSGFDGPQDDYAVRMFLAGKGVRARITAPNLVDHGTLPTLFDIYQTQHPLGPRHSVCPWPSGLAGVDWAGEPLALPAIPYFCWMSGRPVCVVRDPESMHGWGRKPVRWLLDRYDVAMEPVAKQGHAAVAALRSDLSDVDVRLLFGLWLTAFGLGLLLAGSTDDPDEVLEAPLVAHALGTMAPGALKGLVAQDRLTAHAGRLHAFVTGGVRRGHEWVRTR